MGAINALAFLITRSVRIHKFSARCTIVSINVCRTKLGHTLCLLGSGFPFFFYYLFTFGHVAVACTPAATTRCILLADADEESKNILDDDRGGGRARGNVRTYVQRCLRKPVSGNRDSHFKRYPVFAVRSRRPVSVS